jgi:uncharacterized membrane protein
MPRILFRSLVLGLLITALSGAVVPAAAQTGLRISTPYPAISVQPGASLNIALTIQVRRSARVELNVLGVGRGWRATLSGGGNEIQAVFVEPETPVEVALNVEVPEDASGSRTITVAGAAGGERASLDLELNVASAAGGSASLEFDYPTLRGPADEDFRFNLTLINDTPQQLTFAMQAEGPPGWSVSVRPAGEVNAATVTVDSRGEQRLELTASAPLDTSAGTYPIRVAVAAGEHLARAELAVEVTGTTEMQFTTPDQRLNTTASAGSARDFQVVVVNSGTSPLQNVALSGSGPSEWEITFEPEAIDRIAPGESATAVAHITPAGSAVAGDYALSMTARADDVAETLDIRVTVETPPIWGLVGIGLIAATLGGLAWVFRRFGRR